MLRIKLTKGEEIRWYYNPDGLHSGLTENKLLANPYPNKTVADQKINSLKKNEEKLIKDYIMETKDWEE